MRLSSDFLRKIKKSRRLRTGNTDFRSQPPRIKKNDPQLEAENDACVVPEVALVVIAARK